MPNRPRGLKVLLAEVPWWAWALVTVMVVLDLMILVSLLVL